MQPATQPSPRLYSSDEMASLTLDIFQTAYDKGWWPFLENPKQARGEGSARMVVFPEGEIEEKFVLIGTELAEAMEEYRLPDVNVDMIYYNIPSTSKTGFTKIPIDAVPASDTQWKPEGFAVEMADAYIRILDLMGAMGAMPEPLAATPYRKELKVGKHLFTIFSSLFQSRSIDQPLMVMSQVLLLIERACSDLGADLKLAITLKTSYNKTRSVRHGGKKA